MGRAKDLAKRIKPETMSVTIDIEGQLEEVDLYPITVGGWAEIKKKCSIDMWNILLALSEGVSNDNLQGLSEEEQLEKRKSAGMELLKKLDHSVQLQMFHESLRSWDTQISLDETDKIISYGVTNQAKYFQMVMFLVYGVNPEDAIESDAPLAGEGEKESDGSIPTPEGQ